MFTQFFQNYIYLFTQFLWTGPEQVKLCDYDSGFTRICPCRDAIREQVQLCAACLWSKQSSFQSDSTAGQPRMILKIFIWHHAWFPKTDFFKHFFYSGMFGVQKFFLGKPCLTFLFWWVALVNCLYLFLWDPALNTTRINLMIQISNYVLWDLTWVKAVMLKWHGLVKKNCFYGRKWEKNLTDFFFNYFTFIKN